METLAGCRHIAVSDAMEDLMPPPTIAEPPQTIFSMPSHL